MTSIELTTDHGLETDATVMLAKLKGHDIDEQPNEAETQAFCARLKGITHRCYAANLENPDLTPLPQSYRNLRVFDGRDGRLLGSVWWIGSAEASTRAGVGFRTVHSRPTARNVAAVLLSMVFEEIAEWRSTTPMAPSNSGILDLVVDIDTRPRQLLWDGSAMPTHLVGFLASRAPERSARAG